LNYKIFLEIKRSVKNFYENFAEEFSATRVYPWKEVIRYYSLLKNSRIICDLGCGNGRHTYNLLQLADEVIGIDLSFNLLRIAKKKLSNFKFSPINADATYLPFKDSSIDHLISIAMIHHIPSNQMRIKCIKECRRVLKEKGILIFTVWNIMKPKHLWLSFTNYLMRMIKREPIEFGDVFLSWAGKCNRYYHLFHIKEFMKLFREFKILHYCSFGKGFFKDNNLIIALR